MGMPIVAASRAGTSCQRAVVALTWLLAAGCDIFAAFNGGEGMPCTSSQACPTGAACLAGKCRSGLACTDDSSCGAGRRCDPATRSCLSVDAAGPADAATTDSPVADAATTDSTSAERPQRDAVLNDVFGDVNLLDVVHQDATAHADSGAGDHDLVDRAVRDLAASRDISVNGDACVRDCALKCNGAGDGCDGHCWGACATGYDCNVLADQCVDVDECQRATNGCDSCSTTCANTVGSFRCNCRDGFDYNDGQRCQYHDDGDLAVSGNFNLSLLARFADRSCADGAAFSITTINSNVATVAEAVPACCLAPGTAVLLVELQGTRDDTTFTGDYRFETVTATGNNSVTLANAVAPVFGSASVPLTLIGTNPGLHRVALYRLPRYTSVTVGSTGTLTAMPWNGTKGGVLALRSATQVNVNGTIEMTGAGFSGGNSYCGMGSDTGNAFQGESMGGPGALDFLNNIGGGGGGCYSSGCVTSGGGAGYGDPGAGVIPTCSIGDCINPVNGGALYGSGSLLTEKLFLGSGGGGAGQYISGGPCDNFRGGPGGGIVLLLSNALTVPIGGGVHADGLLGTGGTQVGGGGSGGSILLQQNSAILGPGQVTAVGGDGQTGSAGGAGRILCNGSCTGTTTP